MYCYSVTIHCCSSAFLNPTFRPTLLWFSVVTVLCEFLCNAMRKIQQKQWQIFGWKSFVKISSTWKSKSCYWHFIPIQSFCPCKLLTLNTFTLLRNIFVTTPKSLFTTTYQDTTFGRILSLKCIQFVCDDT